jgi:signal transduction histidine kinase
MRAQMRATLLATGCAAWRAPDTRLLASALEVSTVVLALAVAELQGPVEASSVAGGALSGLLVVRVIVRYRSRVGPLADRVSEISTALVAVGSVVATGGWSSPYLLPLGAILSVVAFEQGRVAALVTLLGISATAVVELGVARSRVASELLLGRAGVLVAMVLLSAVTKQVLDAERVARERKFTQVRSLAEVHELLLELHARVASLPAPLGLRDVLRTTVARLRELLDPDVVVLLLREQSQEWQTAVSVGARMAGTVSDADLPRALREAFGTKGVTRIERLEPGEGAGLPELAASGLYVPLWARDRIVGLLAVERAESAPAFSAEEEATLSHVSLHVGLALENANLSRWLRIVGAQEERQRIARDLHDGVAQSLVAIGFGLDSARSRAGAGSEELGEVAKQAREALASLRDMLAELRGGTLEKVGMSRALEDLLVRIAGRSELKVHLDLSGSRKLPPYVEREFWYVAHEAIANVERHARASSVRVRWCCDEDGALLEVVDDGTGIALAAPLRSDAFGLLGMRERAAALGATFRIGPAPGRGTIVRMSLGKCRPAVPEATVAVPRAATGR